MLRPFSGWSQALRDPPESPPETPCSQHVRHPLNIVAMGPRRRSRRAPPPGAGFTVITPGTAGGSGVSQAGNPGRRHHHRPRRHTGRLHGVRRRDGRRRHHHRARGHPDCPHGARPGDRRSQGPGTRELDQAPEPHETTGGHPWTMTARLWTRPESRGSGRNSFTIQHNQTFQEEET